MLLKIGDFGLARPYSVKLEKFTKEVMTLWYRCPELLLGGQIYGPRGDCWGLGCLIGEMASGSAMFSGESEVAVIFKIFRLLGTPTDSDWPGVSRLDHFSRKFPKWNVPPSCKRDAFNALFENSTETPKRGLKTRNATSVFTKCMVGIMEGLLCFSPSQRISAGQVKTRIETECVAPRLLVRD